MISVVVPVYNVEKYITNCLKSIVDQSYKDFELLIVNDGTKDSSIKLVNDYLNNKDINWKIIEKKNGGLASARNVGLKESRGEYISFIDADDCITNNFLEKLISNINKDKYDFSFCNFKYVSKQHIEIEEDREFKVFNKDDLLLSFLRRNINFVVPSMLFRKDFLIKNKLFFDEKIKFSEDQPFIWNVILHSDKSIYDYSKMYGYYLRENSIMTSSSFDKIKNSYFEFKDNIDLIFSSHPEYLSIYSLIIPRWQLGALYTSARILNKEQFKQIYDLFEGKNMFNRIKGIKEKQAYALAAVSSMSCELLYRLSNTLNLNK